MSCKDRLSGITDKSLSSQIHETFHDTNEPLGMLVIVGGRPSQRDVFSDLLQKAAIEGAERTDSRAGMQERNAVVLALVYSLGTDGVILICDLNERDGNDVASMDCR